MTPRKGEKMTSKQTMKTIFKDFEFEIREYEDYADAVLKTEGFFRFGGRPYWNPNVAVWRLEKDGRVLSLKDSPAVFRSRIPAPIRDSFPWVARDSIRAMVSISNDYNRFLEYPQPKLEYQKPFWQKVHTSKLSWNEGGFWEYTNYRGDVLCLFFWKGEWLDVKYQTLGRDFSLHASTVIHMIDRPDNTHRIQNYMQELMQRQEWLSKAEKSIIKNGLRKGYYSTCLSLLELFHYRET